MHHQGNVITVLIALFFYTFSSAAARSVSLQKAAVSLSGVPRILTAPNGLTRPSGIKQDSIGLYTESKEGHRVALVPNYCTLGAQSALLVNVEKNPDIMALYKAIGGLDEISDKEKPVGDTLSHEHAGRESAGISDVRASLEAALAAQDIAGFKALVVSLYQADKGALLNQPNPVTGNTFLHGAVLSNCKEIVAFLLEQDVQSSMWHENSDHETPLHCSMNRAVCESITRLLIEHSTQAALCLPNTLGKPLLHYAIRICKILSSSAKALSITRYLLERCGPEGINGRDSDCKDDSLLHCAVRVGSEPIMKLLFLYGGEKLLLVKNRDGQTPEELAILHHQLLAPDKKEPKKLIQFLHESTHNYKKECAQRQAAAAERLACAQAAHMVKEQRAARKQAARATKKAEAFARQAAEDKRKKEEEFLNLRRQQEEKKREERQQEAHKRLAQQKKEERVKKAEREAEQARMHLEEKQREEERKQHAEKAVEISVEEQRSLHEQQQKEEQAPIKQEEAQKVKEAVSFLPKSREELQKEAELVIDELKNAIQEKAIEVFNAQSVRCKHEIENGPHAVIWLQAFNDYYYKHGVWLPSFAAHCYFKASDRASKKSVAFMLNDLLDMGLSGQIYDRYGSVFSAFRVESHEELRQYLAMVI